MRPLPHAEETMSTGEFGNGFGFRCPNCGDTAHIDIQALIWVRLTEHGTDPDEAHDTDHNWEGSSFYLCTRCASSGRVCDLYDEGVP